MANKTYDFTKFAKDGPNGMEFSVGNKVRTGAGKVGKVVAPIPRGDRGNFIYTIQFPDGTKDYIHENELERAY